jgi:signal transduction histidine kinase
MKIIPVIQAISKIDDRGILYLKELCSLLCKELPINYILIGSLNSDKKSVNSLAFFKDGNDVGEFNYELEHTPCDIVLSKEKELKSYRKNLEIIFPKDHYIPELCLNAYYGCPLYNNVGDLIGIIAIFNENENSLEEENFIKEILVSISRLIGLEIMQLKLLNELAHQQRLSILGQKLSTVAHEVNNPLTIILAGLSYMDVLLKDKKSSELEKVLSRNTKAANKINNLMQDILHFSKNIEHVKLIRVSVHKAIEESIEFEKDLSISSLIDIQLDLQAKNQFILATQGRIEQIIINMTSNSLQSMKDSRTKKITIKTYNEEKNLVILIKDNGSGIDPNVIDSIFDSYFTTKADDDGTGLGLAVCKSLINEMKGEITVDSEIGKGSEFKIILPISFE